MESGGLSLLLNLLESSKDETIRRVVVGAIANLAMNGKTLWMLLDLVLVLRYVHTDLYAPKCFLSHL